MSPHTSAAETTSRPVKFILGTGSQILSSILAQCLATDHEIIIVTCFWAKSKSRDDVSHLLRQLSDKASKTDPNSDHRIRVRLCLSSVSVVQKLLQTNSLDGMIYPPSKWANIGLPEPHELKGLDMVVKSVFVRPFSVMHPKFILVDRRRAFMPSCNVSWEDWFEGCVEMEGDIAGRLFDFWQSFWGRGGSELPRDLESRFPISRSRVPESPPSSRISDQHLIGQTTFSFESPVQTTLLPSPHHKNPKFRPFSSVVAPPNTPLNAFLLEKINAAKCSIYIQTPNLTSRPFIAAILAALTTRGIDVSIVTSRRLMILEQLVTAGTITEFEVWKLRRRYSKCAKQYEALSQRDPETGVSKPGKLEIRYYKPRDGAQEGEPVKSHLKLVIVDDEVVVLGSGNHDRASWYTSQELGVAFFSKEMARDIRSCVDEGLDGRIEVVS